MSGRFGKLNSNETEFLIASWFLSMGWGILIVQITTYFQHRKRDHPVLQGVVFFLFVNETVCMVLHYVAVHFQVNVFVAGSLDDLGMHITASIMGFFSHTTLCMVNLFLIWRYYLFTKRWIISTILAITSLGSCGANYYNNVLAVRSIHYTQKLDIANAVAQIDKIFISCKVSASLEFAVVAVVYVLMLVQLISWLREDLLGAKRLVRHLLFITAESGTITLALAGVNLANSIRDADSTSMVIMIAIAARTYYMTMLFNLNMRNHKGSLVGGGQATNPTLSHLTSQLRTQPSQSVSLGTDHKETVVHIGQDMPIEAHEQLEHEKTAYASIEHGHRNAF